MYAHTYISRYISTYTHYILKVISFQNTSEIISKQFYVNLGKEEFHLQVSILYRKSQQHL